MTSNRRNDPEGQAAIDSPEIPQEDSPELLIDSDLHTILSACKRLLVMDGVPWRLQMAVEYMGRAIIGCATCHRSLGYPHGPACLSLQGRAVLDSDLPPDLDYYELLPEARF